MSAREKNEKKECCFKAISICSVHHLWFVETREALFLRGSVYDMRYEEKRQRRAELYIVSARAHTKKILI